MTFKELDLPREFKGRVLTEEVEPYNYEEARTLYNRIRDGHPAAIVQVLDVDDVAIVARHASERGIPIAVHGGGHGQDCYSMPEGSLVIDFALMRKVEVDTAAGIVKADAGCWLGDLDVGAAAHGLAAVAGTVFGTGIAGLTLGGGVGWLMRKFGTTIDNVVAIDAVSVDGRILRASETENPDLFWAMRGGGGNFAIATSFEYRGHPITEVTGGSIVHGPDLATEYMKRWRDTMLDAPREIGSILLYGVLPPLAHVPAELVGEVGTITLICHHGDAETAADDLRPLLDVGPPVGSTLRRRSYLEMQREQDFANVGGRVHQLGGYLREFSDETIAALRDGAGAFPQGGAPTDGRLTAITRLGGAIDDFPEDSAAFSRREGAFSWETMPVWEDPAVDDEMIAWAENVRAALVPWTADACYINFSMYQGPQWLERVYGAAKFRRLREVKADWDPQNLLRFNKNILPAERS